MSVMKAIYSLPSPSTNLISLSIDPLPLSLSSIHFLPSPLFLFHIPSIPLTESIEDQTELHC